MSRGESDVFFHDSRQQERRRERGTTAEVEATLASDLFRGKEFMQN
jgi:hypothetical protein